MGFEDFLFPLRILIFVASVLMVLSFIRVASLGLKLKRRDRDYQEYLRAHRRAINVAMGATVAAVLLIEPYVRLISDPYAFAPRIFVIHLVFDAIFVCSFLIARFWLTGEKHRSRHAYAAWSVLISLVGLAGTGWYLYTGAQ